MFASWAYFSDASFDNTLALLVINFVPDHRKAVTEMRRVTRPQGIVSACVWDYDQGMQMLRFFWDEAIALDPAIEPKDERHMKLSHQGQLGDLWSAADLINIKEEPITRASVMALAAFPGLRIFGYTARAGGSLDGASSGPGSQFAPGPIATLPTLPLGHEGHARLDRP